VPFFGFVLPLFLFSSNPQRPPVPLPPRRPLRAADGGSDPALSAALRRLEDRLIDLLAGHDAAAAAGSAAASAGAVAAVEDAEIAERGVLVGEGGAAAGEKMLTPRRAGLAVAAFGRPPGGARLLARLAPALAARAADPAWMATADTRTLADLAQVVFPLLFFWHVFSS
jgi:hypothetical protein